MTTEETEEGPDELNRSISNAKATCRISGCYHKSGDCFLTPLEKDWTGDEAASAELLDELIAEDQKQGMASAYVPLLAMEWIKGGDRKRMTAEVWLERWEDNQR